MAELLDQAHSDFCERVAARFRVAGLDSEATDEDESAVYAYAYETAIIAASTMALHSKVRTNPADRFDELFQAVRHRLATAVDGDPVFMDVAFRMLRDAVDARDRQRTLELVRPPEESTCRHCGQPIRRWNWSWGEGTWFHHAPGDATITFYGTRTCRAWSFERLGKWDDALQRWWKAEPEGG